jgi:5-amino-6-(5-phospho-D-ribitylamino)uracil phosphatase
MFAAIFDWDGVIIDSSRQHELSWQQLAKEHQRELPPNFFLKSFGMKNEKIIPELLGWVKEVDQVAKVALQKEMIYRDLIKKNGISALPGVHDLLEGLKKASVPCAIGSSSPRENISCIIEVLGVAQYFKTIVCGEDVHRGKPDPEVFLLAAKRLGASPENCVVFEDAHVGLEAAKRAGMKVVGVATTHPADTLHDADLVVNRLTDVSVADLEKLFKK